MGRPIIDGVSPTSPKRQRLRGAPQGSAGLEAAKAGSRGLDVYHQNGTVDWQAIAASGWSFAIAKATEGDTFVDDQFSGNWPAMKEVGLIRGAYHFFRPSTDPRRQAEHFLERVGALEVDDLPPIVDIEVTDGLPAGEVLDSLRLWIDRIGAASARRPIIYTYPFFWGNRLGNSPRFSECALWIADYSVRRQPRIPGGWRTWSIWQYSASGRTNGLEPPVDLNRSNGPIAEVIEGSRTGSVSVI